jgi:hypothetical protein
LFYWISEPDGGPFEALNKGFSIATGEIMGWLNADDLLLPGALDNLGEIFGAFPNVHWISGRPSFVDKNGKLIDVGYVLYVHRLEYLCGGLLLQQESTFWRKSLWEKSGGYIAETIAFDFELWLRFFRYASVFPLRTVLAGFRYHDSQLSVKYANQYRSEMKRLIINELRGNRRLKIKFILWKYVRYVLRINKLIRVYDTGPYLTWGCPKAIYYERSCKRFINPNK